MNRIRQFFLKDLWLKGISLLLALLLWNQVTSQETVQRSIAAPVVFRNMPLGLEISNDHPTSVDVMLRTNRRGASIEGATVVIDLKTAEAGINVLNLTETEISRPSDVDVLSINPSRIRLSLERTSSKRVKLEPVLQGDPAEGFEITGIQVVPPDILISGPESHVQLVTAALTGPIDVDGRSAGFRRSVFVDIEDSRLRIEGVTNVDVVVSIEEKRRQVVIRGVLLKLAPQGVEARLMNRSVTLEGTVPISYTGELDSALFVAEVDVTGLAEQAEPHEIVPRIVIPEEYSGVFRLDLIKPERVKVRKSG